MRLSHLELFFREKTHQQEKPLPSHPDNNLIPPSHQADSEMMPNFPKLYYLAKAVNNDPDPLNTDRFSRMAELYEDCQKVFTFLAEKKGEEIPQIYFTNLIRIALQRRPRPSYEYVQQNQLPTPKPWWIWIMALLSTPVALTPPLAEGLAAVFKFEKISRLDDASCSEVKSHLTAFLELRDEGVNDFAIDIGFMLSLMKSEKFNYSKMEKIFFLFALLPMLYKKCEILPETLLPEALREYYWSLGLANRTGKLELAPSEEARAKAIKTAARPFIQNLFDSEFLVFLRKYLGPFSNEIISQNKMTMLRAKPEKVEEIRAFLNSWNMTPQETLNTDETWFSFDNNIGEDYLLNHLSKELPKRFLRNGVNFICDRAGKSLRIIFTDRDTQKFFITQFPRLGMYFIENNSHEEFISFLNLGLLEAVSLFLLNSPKISAVVEHKSREAQTLREAQQRVDDTAVSKTSRPQTRRNLSEDFNNSSDFEMTPPQNPLIQIDSSEPEFLQFLRINLGTLTKKILAQENLIEITTEKTHSIQEFLKRWNLPSTQIQNEAETTFILEHKECKSVLLEGFSNKFLELFSQDPIQFIVEVMSGESLQVSFYDPISLKKFLAKNPALAKHATLINTSPLDFFSLLNLSLVEAASFFPFDPPKETTIHFSMKEFQAKEEDVQAEVDRKMQKMLRNMGTTESKAPARSRTRRNRTNGTPASAIEQSTQTIDALAAKMTARILEDDMKEFEEIKIGPARDAEPEGGFVYRTRPSPLEPMLCEILTQVSKAKLISIREGELYVTVDASDDSKKSFVKQQLSLLNIKNAEEHHGTMGTHTILIYRIIPIASLIKTFILDPMEYFKTFIENVTLIDNQRIVIVFQLHELEDRLPVLSSKHPELASFIEYNDINDTTQIILNGKRMGEIFESLQRGMEELGSGMLPMK